MDVDSNQEQAKVWKILNKVMNKWMKSDQRKKEKRWKIKK